MPPWAVLSRLLIEHKFHRGLPPLGAQGRRGLSPQKDPTPCPYLVLGQVPG